MLEIYGKYSMAKIFIDTIEETAREQIQTLCNQEFVSGTKVRIMPDVHAGAGCVIGFTANLGEMVIPNIVGVDIGCGMLTVALNNIDLDLGELDAIIKQNIPSGIELHEGKKTTFSDILKLQCYRELKRTSRFERSIGTLGGGNHFIEVDVDNENNKFLVIHTGSRNLGKQVADYYQNLAFEVLSGKDMLIDVQGALIAQYKRENRESELQSTIVQLKKEFALKTANIPKQLCYLTGKYREAYLHDMKICQEFATLNRKTIASIILDKALGKGLEDFCSFETVHNYIDTDTNIVRKGSVSAMNGEQLLIPINMRDGSLLCIGKGNEDWNCSAPHGAGRLFSRNKAKETFTIEQFESSMYGVYTSSVNENTLDECPMAYKDMSDIVSNIGPTAEILKVIKPIYNFKAGE